MYADVCSCIWMFRNHVKSLIVHGQNSPLVVVDEIKLMTTAKIRSQCTIFPISHESKIDLSYFSFYRIYLVASFLWKLLKKAKCLPLTITQMPKQEAKKLTSQAGH